MMQYRDIPLLHLRGTYRVEVHLQMGMEIAMEEWKNLWNSTIKKPDINHYGWDANPWVWVIEFERCEKPEGM